MENTQTWFSTKCNLPFLLFVATAYLCGSKANIDTIGVSPRVTLNNCTAQMDPTNQLDSILSWAQSAGKSTGVVTTTRITHASPAGKFPQRPACQRSHGVEIGRFLFSFVGTYAHSCNRDMEDDAEVSSSFGLPGGSALRESLDST